MTDNTALTPQQVAEILKITKNTVYELIKRGELNGYRVGNKVRVDQADVDAYKDKSRTGGTSQTVSGAIRRRSFLAAQPKVQSSREQGGGFIICGQDALLDILAARLEQSLDGAVALRSHQGSYNGLFDLYMGRVQVASCHLWDGDSGMYNVPYVRRMLPGVPAVILRLAGRMQGFYVANGNPKGIGGWEDLNRPDLTLVNREKGSGTRVLLDEHLRLMGVSGLSIQGYDQEAISHLAVASAVAQGKADLGIGHEKAARQVMGVDFIPMQSEQYDLVIKRDDWEQAPFDTLVQIIRSDDFRRELEGIGGYDLRETGKIIAET